MHRDMSSKLAGMCCAMMDLVVVRVYMCFGGSSDDYLYPLGIWYYQIPN